MQAILITVTALALGTTAVLSVLVIRLLRDERRRSDARVRLLTELAGIETATSTSAVPALDLDLRRGEVESVQVGSLFDEHHEPSPWPRRFAGAAVFAVLIGVAAFGWSFVSPRRSEPPPPAAVASWPLELLSMTHRQDAGALTITGVVQNPRRAGLRTNLQATAHVFGSDGALLGSGHAPLDFATLRPGDESPFVIRVNVTGAARYRVSFRTNADQPLPHVDRRGLDAVARKEAP